MVEFGNLDCNYKVDFCLMEVIRRHFKLIDSTNTWAKQNAPSLPHDKVTLVTADEQTAGRGRFKRKWESPPGQNIYATFCVFIEKHRTDIGNLPQVMAISAAEMLEHQGLHARLKWPNDVMLSDKKAAGILCETTPLSDLLCVALGIGLNVNMPLDLLEKIDRPATSLLAEDGLYHDVEEVTLLLQKHFMQNLEIFLEEGFHIFLNKYRGRLLHVKGDKIRFHDNRSIWEGYFDQINVDGSLSLLLDTGEKRTFIAGEIV